MRYILNRHIPDDVKVIERNGYIFFAHPTKRYDPVFTPILLGTMIAGTVMGVAGTLEEGKQAEKIAKQRAAVDEANAEAARKVAVKRAKIKGEKGRRLIEEQKGAAAAGGIRLNVGSPLVIEAQTRSDIAKDVGFILEAGREESRFYRTRAAFERARGKQARKQSKISAWTQGLMGFGSIAFMGSQAGLFGKAAPTPITVGPTSGFQYSRNFPVSAF